MTNFGFLSSKRFALLLALLVFTAWQGAFIAAVDTTSLTAPLTGDFMDTINTKVASLSPRASFGKKRMTVFGVGSLVAGGCFYFSHVFMDSSDTLKHILQGVSAILYFYAAVQMLFFKKHFAALHTLFVFVLPIVSTPLMFFLIPSLSHLVVLQETIELPPPSSTAFGAAMATAVNSDSVKVFMDKIVKAVKAATSAISSDKVKAAVISRLFEKPGGYVVHLLEASDKKAAYENVVDLATSMKNHFSQYYADAANFPFAANIDAAKKAYATAVVTAKGPALLDAISCLRALVDGLEDSNKSKYKDQILELRGVVRDPILKPFLDLVEKDKIAKDQSEMASSALKELKSLDSVLLNSHVELAGDIPLLQDEVDALKKVVAKPKFSAEEEIKGAGFVAAGINESKDSDLEAFAKSRPLLPTSPRTLDIQIPNPKRPTTTQPQRIHSRMVPSKGTLPATATSQKVVLEVEEPSPSASEPIIATKLPTEPSPMEQTKLIPTKGQQGQADRPVPLRMQPVLSKKEKQQRLAAYNAQKLLENRNKGLARQAQVHEERRKNKEIKANERNERAKAKAEALRQKQIAAEEQAKLQKEQERLERIRKEKEEEAARLEAERLKKKEAEEQAEIKRQAEAEAQQKAADEEFQRRKQERMAQLQKVEEERAKNTKQKPSQQVNPGPNPKILSAAIKARKKMADEQKRATGFFGRFL